MALLADDPTRPRLFVAGPALDTAELTRRARALRPALELSRVKAVPMDARHGSKVDYGRLRQMAR